MKYYEVVTIDHKCPDPESQCMRERFMDYPSALGRAVDISTDKQREVWLIEAWLLEPVQVEMMQAMKEMDQPPEGSINGIQEAISGTIKTLEPGENSDLRKRLGK